MKSKSKLKNKRTEEKIQKLFKKLIPNLKEEDFFENKKDSIVYSYLMKNQTVNSFINQNTTGRIASLEKLTAINQISANAQDDSGPQNETQSSNSEDPNSSSDSPQGPNDNSDSNLAQNSTMQSNLPSHLLLEKKTSAHSIFDAVDDDSAQTFPAPSENRTVILLGKNYSLRVNGTADLKTNSPISIFDAAIENDNNSNDTVLVEIKNSTKNTSNLTNLDQKIKQFNESLKIDPKQNQTSNLSEIQKLATKNKALMIEIKSNTNSSTKVENKHTITKFNTTNKNDTFIDKDKQERIAKFYKAYREKRKQLQKKLKELNKPPLFKTTELTKAKRLKKKNPQYIKKRYESPNKLDFTSENIITDENAAFGPITIHRKAYQIDPNIPHYGYIGQQIFYNNIPDFYMKSYRRINS